VSRLLIVSALVALVAVLGFSVAGGAFSSLAGPVLWVFAFLFVVVLFVSSFGVRAPRT